MIRNIKLMLYFPLALSHVRAHELIKDVIECIVSPACITKTPSPSRIISMISEKSNNARLIMVNVKCYLYTEKSE